MNIVIFKELTTEEQLIELEESAKSYDGLYVDMENKDERKFVKDKASHIQALLKKLDRQRIDETKDYKLKVEAEAGKIKERLESANAPFMLLINQHKEQRKKELALEKLEKDHAEAVELNELFELARPERERLAREAEEDRKSQELKDAESKRVADLEAAEQKRLNDIEAIKQQAIREQEAKEAAERKRLADIDHVTSVCTKVKESLMLSAGLTEAQAIEVVKAIRGNKIESTSIKF